MAINLRMLFCLKSLWSTKLIFKEKNYQNRKQTSYLNKPSMKVQAPKWQRVNAGGKEKFLLHSLNAPPHPWSLFGTFRLGCVLIVSPTPPVKVNIQQLGPKFVKNNLHNDNNILSVVSWENPLLEKQLGVLLYENDPGCLEWFSYDLEKLFR